MSNVSLYIPLLVAAITGVISLWALAINAWLTERRERANRRREICSKAFTAAVAYEEFPYIVRRRCKSDPEGERIRISTELRKGAFGDSYNPWVPSL